MNDLDILRYFSLFLLGYVFSAFTWYCYVIYYNKKGIRFLQGARDIIFHRNDKEEFDKITNVDLPAIMSILPSVYGETLLAFIVLSINAITYLFTLVPVAHTTSAWTITIYMASIGTAYIMISINTSNVIVRDINIICSQYSLILESYNHIDEYKEKDDDSSDGL